MYIVTRSIDQGRGAGLASVAGIHVGTLFHLALATLGLSAILVSSAAAFTVVKVVGALYLIVIVIGIRTARLADSGLCGYGLQREGWREGDNRCVAGALCLVQRSVGAVESGARRDTALEQRPPDRHGHRDSRCRGCDR